jgi:predicted nuclease of predicted toxin-antitoxin system
VNALLIDENLPADLSRTLGAECVHVTDLGGRLTDQEMWDYARDHHLTILTKDADFFDLMSLRGAPPKVIWVRTGNLRRTALESMLRDRWLEIRSLSREADLVVVHDDRLEALKF